MKINHELFLKVESKIASTFALLDKYSAEEKSLALMEINESIWFLERVEPLLFEKIVKDLKVKLDKLRNPIHPILSGMENARVERNNLIFSYGKYNYEFPLVSVTEAKEYLKADADYFPGYFLQLGFLMRSENYLSLCLIKAYEQGKLCTP